MKKLIFTMIVMLAGVSAFAQNTTRIGAEHKWAVGGALTHAFYEVLVEGKDVNNAGFLSLEKYSESSNFRVRLNVEWLERTHFCPAGSLDAQYLFPIGETGLYVYPSIGVYGETFHDNFDLGLQAAAGLEYHFNSRFGAFVETSYQHILLNGWINRVFGTAGIKVALGL